MNLVFKGKAKLKVNGVEIDMGEATVTQLTENKPRHPKTLIGEILMFLAKQDGRWSTWGTGFYMPTVQSVFKVGTTEKQQLKFMRSLQKQGLVGGCDCGCRGDYAPTEKGLQFLAEECSSGEQELERWKENNFMLGY